MPGDCDDILLLCGSVNDILVIIHFLVRVRTLIKEYHPP